MKTLNEMGREFIRHSGVQLKGNTGLHRAAEELQEALVSTSDAACLEEMADVVLTLASVAAYHGLDLTDAIKRKHAMNLARKWGPHPTIPGAVQHIKEPGSEPTA